MSPVERGDTATILLAQAFSGRREFGETQDVVEAVRDRAVHGMLLSLRDMIEKYALTLHAI